MTPLEHLLASDRPHPEEGAFSALTSKQLWTLNYVRAHRMPDIDPLCVNSVAERLQVPVSLLLAHEESHRRFRASIARDEADLAEQDARLHQLRMQRFGHGLPEDPSSA